MKNIAVLGAGWLGTSLAKQLQETYVVKVSTRSLEKQTKLQQQGFNTFIVDLNLEDTYTNDAFFINVDVLIVSLTPQPIEVFKKLIALVKKHGIKKVLLFSSIGVYAGLKGVVNETSALNTENPKVTLLKSIEDVFLKNNYFNTTILRLGGLIGEDRHPVYHLAKKNVIEDGNEPVNLIEKDAIIETIYKLLLKPFTSTVLNVVNNNHTTKEVFYTQAANQLNLTLPVFKHNEIPHNRIVSNEKLERFLNKKS